MANILQGCFKNGTTPSTRDFRWFAGLLDFCFFYDHYGYSSSTSSIILLFICLYLLLLLCWWLHYVPYRCELGNNVDTGFWLLLTFTTSWYVCVLVDENIPKIMTQVFSAFPIFYIVFLFLWTVFSSVYKCCRPCCKKKEVSEDHTVPDRLINTNEYTSLLLSSAHSTPQV